MKNALLALAASTTLALALGSVDAAFAQSYHDEHGGDRHGGGRGEDRGGDRGGDRVVGRGGSRAAQGFSDERGPRTYHDGGHREGGHWEGGPVPPPFRGERWDDHRNNGYYMNSRWHYGPPPEDYYGRPGFALGRSDWRLGSYLPPYYRSWVVNDYARWRLRRPPYGYNWIRVGNDYLLVAAGSGLIFDIVRY
jgi:Ni/Co efflux regulator RcnB